MEISRIRALRGPNLWTRQTAIEAIVHCEPAERSLAGMPDFEPALRAQFPQLGLWRHDRQDMSLAHVLKLVALALQAQAGCPVSFSRCTETVEKGTYQVVVEYTEEAVGREASRLSSPPCGPSFRSSACGATTGRKCRWPMCSSWWPWPCRPRPAAR